MIKNFKQQLNKLPNDAQDFLLSDFGDMRETDLADKYKISTDQKYLLEEAVSLLYFGVLKFSDLIDVLGRAFGFNKNIARQLAIDLVGVRLLVADDFFKGRASSFVTKNGGNISDYQKDVERTKKALELGGLEELEEWEREQEKELKAEEFIPAEVPLNQEKKSAIETFGTGLTYFLDEQSPELKEVIEELNYSLMIWFDDDPTFKRNLENSLYSNSEKLTDKEIRLSGKLVKPTIANWLKDFIAKNGSNYFDNVVLSEYLTNSENARKLSADEKERLSRLLNLYRNIKFFPQVLANQPANQWELIPLNRKTPSNKSGNASVKGKQTSITKVTASVGKPNKPSADNLSEIERRALEQLKK